MTRSGSLPNPENRQTIPAPVLIRRGGAHARGQRHLSLPGACVLVTVIGNFLQCRFTKENALENFALETRT